LLQAIDIKLMMEDGEEGIELPLEEQLNICLEGEMIEEEQHTATATPHNETATKTPTHEDEDFNTNICCVLVESAMKENHHHHHHHHHHHENVLSTVQKEPSGEQPSTCKTPTSNSNPSPPKTIASHKTRRLKQSTTTTSSSKPVLRERSMNQMDNASNTTTTCPVTDAETTTSTPMVVTQTKTVMKKAPVLMMTAGTTRTPLEKTLQCNETKQVVPWMTVKIVVAGATLRKSLVAVAPFKNEEHTATATAATTTPVTTAAAASSSCTPAVTHRRSTKRRAPKERGETSVDKTEPSTKKNRRAKQVVYMHNFDTSAVKLERVIDIMANIVLKCPKMTKTVHLVMVQMVCSSSSSSQQQKQQEEGEALVSCRLDEKPNPPPGKLSTSFFWHDYPALESLLFEHMEEYYLLSSNRARFKDQMNFNNMLVDSFRQRIEQYGWSLSDAVTNKQIRDRIRCFYKTLVQNAKKRLRTMMNFATTSSCDQLLAVWSFCLENEDFKTFLDEHGIEY
jgi:hypothetical protein